LPSLTFSSLQTVSPPLARSTEPQDVMSEKKGDEVAIGSLPKLLENDTKVKLAGVDVDGILRGKLISKKKFLGIAKEGFGFCSVIFGWDMHDQTYFRELKISNADNGYHDLIAIPDLSSFRRIPWEDDVPFFLVSFFDPDSGKPVSACPRGLLKTTVDKLHEKGYGAMAGGMFFQVVVNIKPG
jgi:glutamine synthetase